MSLQKTITLKTTLDDRGLDELQSELNAVDRQQEKVSGSAKKASSSIKEIGDNGGAISTLDSLTGGLATRIRDAFEASKLFNGSLKATRTALIATGIGAFVVALGVVVAYWDDIVDFMTEANERLDRQIDLQRTIVDDLDFELKLLAEKEKQLLAEGKSVEEIKVTRKEILTNLINENAVLIEKLRTQNEIETANEKELSFWERQKINILQATGLYEKAAKARLEATGFGEEDIKNRKAREKEIQDALLRQAQLETRLAENLNPTSNSSGGRDKVQSVGSVRTAEQQQELLDKKSKQFEELFDLEKMQQDQLNELGKSGLEAALNDENIANAKRAEAAKKFSKSQVKIAEQEAQQKRDILSAQADALFAFSDLLKVLGEENKAIAIAGLIAEQIASTAKIIVATGESNAKAAAASPLTLGQPFVTLNTIAAGLSIATGAAATVKAISELGGSGGGVTSNNIANSAGGQSAPSFNVVGTSGTNQLAQSLSEDQNPVQAYVVGSNVTTQQELDRNIVDTATIG